MTIRVSIRVLAALASAMALASVAVEAAPIPSNQVRILGSIDYGETSQPVHYTGLPRYEGFRFNAKAGDRLAIQADAKQGHVQAFLANAKYEILAGGDARFEATIPAGSKPSTYCILVTEINRRPTIFTVNLEQPSSASATPDAAKPNFLACQADSDCVAIDRPGCCNNGFKDAVNRHQVQAYTEANSCENPHVRCPQFRILDRRVAVCNQQTKRCEMVNPSK